MSETKHFAETVLLRFWLFVRLAAVAASLAVALVLSRTVFAPDVAFSMKSSKPLGSDFWLILVHVPLFVAFWITANSIFRATNRRTLVEEVIDDETSMVVLILIFTVPVALISSFALFAYGNSFSDRVEISLIASMIASIPFLLWNLFSGGVLEVFRKEQRELRRRRRANERRQLPNFTLRMRLLRRDYEEKIREINHMRVPEEERLYLRELADSEYRNGVAETIGGTNNASSGGNSASIESLLQDNEES